MTEKKVPENPAPLEMNGWQEGTYDARVGENRREDAASKVSPSGWYTYNVAATEVMDSVALARGIPHKNYYLKYFTHKAEGKAGFVPTTATGKGIAAVRRYENNGSSHIVFYHSGPFKEAPDLRPLTKVKANVTIETLPFDGLPFVTVAVKKGLPVKTKSRKKKKDSQATDAAAEAAPPQTPAESAD